MVYSSLSEAHPFIVVFISGSFVPLIPQIASDLESTGAVVRQVPFSSLLFNNVEPSSFSSLSISLAMFASALGSLSGGSYSTYCNSFLSLTWHALIHINPPRRKKADIHSWPWSFSCRVFGRRIREICEGAYVLAVYPDLRRLSWKVRRSRRHW